MGSPISWGKKMKRKTGISLMLALLIVISTFVVVGSTEINSANTSPPQGEIDFDKEVWNGTGWDESVEAQVGETVTFKITLTYHADETAPEDWTLNAIKVKDYLPECLDFVQTTSVTTSGSSQVEYVEEVSGKWVYWNFTWDKPALDDDESLYIEFTAIVVESQEIENENIAYFTAKEDCTYDHNGDDKAWVFVVEYGEPGIEIDKKVWDGEDWNDEGITEYLCEDEDQCIDFQINVSNTGEIALRNVVVTDVLPEFLKYKNGSASPPEAWVSPDMRTIVWELGTIPVDGYVLITFTACIWPQYFLMHDMAEGDNVANATSDQTEVVEDSVYVKLFKRLSVDKKVWDGEEWVDELERVIKGQEVKFRITATYHGEPQSLMDCALLGDLLSNDCLEYNETTLVQVAGETLEPGTYQYPYVIPDYGTTINICGQEVEIPDLIECGEDEYYVIIWDFREAWYFELHDGENITIEFTTNMTQYCECYNVDFAFAIGWGCYVCDPCNYYLDWDCARVNCSAPETKFSKKVWDVEEGLWADEGFGVVGQEMEFKLEFEYYGNDVLTDIRFKDVLPCVLEFTEVIESSINISVWVSDDKKLIWFNMSEDTVEDCDVVIIRFTALVTGVTGDCCPDVAKNRVWLYIYECTGQIIDEYYDEVCLTTRENLSPCPPAITGDTYGIVDQKLTFQALVSDPNGDDIYYMFDWGDETYSEWLGPYGSGEEVETNNSWSTIGEYEVKAKAKDTFGEESDWSPYPLIVEIVNNPPTASVINGPTNGDVGTSYSYTFTSTDPDGDQVSYYVDWGDGTTPVWSSFQASGATYSASHTWTSTGTYIIQAKAKDTFGEESDWSDPLTVEIVEPGTPKLSVKIKRGFRRDISFEIENTGDVDVNDITWNITVTRRGLIKKTLLQCNGTISALEPGSKETVIKSLSGISRITVTVEIDASGIDHIDPISETVKGFTILRFVRLRR